MQASHLIDKILRYTGNYYSRQELLDELDHAQNAELGNNCAFMYREMDIATTDGVYTYSFPKSIDTLIVRELLDIASDLPNNNTVCATYLTSQRRSRYKTNVTTWSAGDPVSGNQGSFTLENNPGTGTLHIRAYVWPTALLTESVSIFMPDEFSEDLLRLHMMIEIREAEFGNAEELHTTYRRVRNRWLAYVNNRFPSQQKDAWGYPMAELTSAWRL